MEELIEKIKEYKIIVICAGLGLVLGGFFLLKPVAQAPAKETKVQTEVAAVQRIRRRKRKMEIRRKKRWSKI